MTKISLSFVANTSSASSIGRCCVCVCVSVDEGIPLTSKDRQMLFAQPNGHELWVSMRAKAFAKFCGSYGALDGGQTGWAFNALTGDPVFKLKKSDGEGDAAKWSRLDMRVEPGRVE